MTLYFVHDSNSESHLLKFVLYSLIYRRWTKTTIVTKKMKKNISSSNNLGKLWRCTIVGSLSMVKNICEKGHGHRFMLNSKDYKKWENMFKIVRFYAK